MSKIGASADLASLPGYVESELIAGFWSAALAARGEILLFVIAFATYFALSQQKALANARLSSRNKKVNEESDDEDKAKLKASGSIGKISSAVDEEGDHRSVLRQWNAVKLSKDAAAISLPRVVEAMQRTKKDTPCILGELKAFFQKFPSEKSMTRINDLLESLARRLDSPMMEKMSELLPSLGLTMDERTYEIFLNMHFTMRHFTEVEACATEMESKQISFTTRSKMIMFKVATKVGKLDRAKTRLRDLKITLSGQGLSFSSFKFGASGSASLAPSNALSDFVDLACKEHRLGETIGDLRDLTLPKEVVHRMLSECAKQQDSQLACLVEQFMKDQDMPFDDTAYSFLVRSVGIDTPRLGILLDEVVASGVEVTTELASSILASSVQASSLELADRLYAHMQANQMCAVSPFISFYVDSQQYDKACDVYEHAAVDAGDATTCSRPLRLDPRVERNLMKAALKCNREHLSQSLLSASPSDIAKHITMIRNCAADHNLQGAMGVFDSLQRSGADIDAVVYNTMLDACVQCRDIASAEAWMEKTKKAGMADVVSFNTLIKAHLQSRNFARSRCLMEEMRKQGLQPDIFTFNELINAVGSSKQTWALVAEMKTAGVKPNQVTISILLKTLSADSGSAEIVKTMDLIDAMEEPMDEVLLSSVVEACVRIGRPALLEKKLKQLQGSPAYAAISGSHTYGSLIKAYGHTKDLEGAWRCWRELRSRHIKPTNITLGCMVEAIVNQGDTESAYDLIQQLLEDPLCRDCVNAVAYCSVLKGFAREKKIDRAWVVYQDMRSLQAEATPAAYNTLIDACARCGRMERLPEILEDMRSRQISPNLITYSTMLKGHCQNGEVQKGFQILAQMKREQDVSLKPDERMYNSLLDGCAQERLVDEGLRLVEEMQAEGVNPSNFTLSVLVKLLTRGRRLEQAFASVATITKKYRFRPNVHVYNNLVHGCVANRQLARGMSVLEEMVGEQIQPDSRTYATLVRASIQHGLFEQASGLLRSALGLEHALPGLQQPAAICHNLDSAFISEALVSLSERGHAEDHARPLMTAIQQHVPKIRIGSATERKILSPSSIPDRGSQGWKGHGKGRPSCW